MSKLFPKRKVCPKCKVCGVDKLYSLTFGSKQIIYKCKGCGWMGTI